MIHRFLRLFFLFREAEADARLATAHGERCKREALDDREKARRASDAEARLHTELQRENAAKLQLQDRCRDLEADNLQLRTALTEAQAKTVHSTEMVADWLAQLQFGRKIYDGAPALPEHPAEAEIIQRPRAQARLAVEEETRAFYQELLDRTAQQPQ